MTERAKKLLLLYYKQSRKIRRVSGLPPLTFKAKKAGTLKNYRIYGNTETLTRSYSGSAPISFPIVDGAVSNYRVYGQTSRNLFDKDNMGNGIIDAYINSDGTIVTDQSTWRVTQYIPCNSNVITLSSNAPLGHSPSICLYDENKNYITGTKYNSSVTVIVTAERVAKYIRFSYPVAADLSKIMLNAGSTALPYEPYGESVGNKTENIFDKSKANRIYDTARNDDGSFNYNPSSSNYFDYYIPVKPNTNYVAKGSVDASSNLSCTPSRMYFFDSDKNWLGRTDLYIGNIEPIRGYIIFNTPANCFFTQIQEDKSRLIDTDKFMIVKGSTVPENYIPYGYRIPITNNSETANIYLDEPLRKVGNEAEYIDYATQKRHNADGTSADVTLPDLPAQFSTNSLSVGTAVQPSSVAVDVSEIVSCGDKVTDSQSVNYGKYKIPVTLTADSAETTDIYLDEALRKVGDEAEYIDYGEQKQHRVRKNLLPNAAVSSTVHGITVTANEDGSITCDGTATTVAEITLYLDFSLSAGNYLLTGCPSGGGVASYCLRAWYSISGAVTWIIDTGAGRNFTLTDTTTMRSSIVINSGQVLDHITFYPMIRKADIEDDTYEPYIENTEVDVTLPALPTMMGTNTLTVGTEVQPSSVEIKGRIKAAGGD